MEIVEFAPEQYEILNKEYGVSKEFADVAMKTYAKGFSYLEFCLYLGKAKAYGLDIQKKEIRGYKDNKGNLVMFTGRDGMISLAKRTGEYVSLNSMEVCIKDTFELDIPNESVYHRVSVGERGEIIGAYAITKNKVGGKTVVWADLKTYDKQSFTRNSHKADMIKKVAETQALKKMFGISGIYSEAEYDSIVMSESNKGGGNYAVEDSEEAQQIIENIANCQNLEELENIREYISGMKKEKRISKIQENKFRIDFAYKKQELMNNDSSSNAQEDENN